MVHICGVVIVGSTRYVAGFCFAVLGGGVVLKGFPYQHLATMAMIH